MQLDLKLNSAESDELEVISILIEAYEKDNYPVEALTLRPYLSRIIKKGYEYTHQRANQGVSS